MTKEEIMELNFEQVEERRNAIVEEIETADSEALDALNEELDAIEERKAVLKREADEKREAMKEVIEGDGEIVEEVKEEREIMEKIEIRNTPEYLDAWVENLKGRASEEQRALLTQNATPAGTIAVPSYVDDTIHTAWESDEILRRVRRTYYPGNLKVGYEASASPAAIHDEGGDPVAEETLTLGVVELIPVMTKKWISFSDEALDMRGEAFVDYIVDEITHQIIMTIVGGVGNVMAESTLTQSVTMSGTSLTTADIIAAGGQLSGEASNPVVITTRANAAALKAAALNAGYAYDPFDGMEVLYTARLPLGAGGKQVHAFVADLSGIQANFPNGDEVKIKIDDITLAASDMVRVIGRLYVAMDVVAPGKVAAILAA